MGRENSVINLNTLILMVLTALTAVIINNSAKTYSAVIRLEVQQDEISRRVTNLETVVGMVNPGVKRAPTQ
jgi:hypothetical protein